METNIINPNTRNNGKTMAGVIILIIGSILLINQLQLCFIPAWLFSWPIFMIAYGLYMGGKYNFRKPIWIWITVLGAAFLLTDNIDNAERFVWPAAIIGIGTWMVLKHSNHTKVAYPGSDNYKEI